MAYMAFDLETQIHQRYKRKANPFIAENYVVARGYKVEGQQRNTMQYYGSKAEVRPMEIPDNVDVLYGFNIKFDLLYEMCIPGGRENLMRFINRGGRIWDGQYAKFLVSGQMEKYHMCSMDEVVEEYGGRKKIDGLKELWAAGVQTSDIDRDLLEDYLIGTSDEDRNSGDIGNTILICEGTIAEAKELGMYDALLRRMDGLLATTEMEYNGLCIDLARGARDMQTRMDELAEVEKRLADHISFIPEEVGFNWGSGVQVSCLLFGGNIRYKKQAPYLDEATGKLARYKATERWPLFNGEAVNPHREDMSERNGLWYSDTLKAEQDTFRSGKKIGEGKFRNVDVEGEIKVKYQDFFFECAGYTQPKAEWKGAQTTAMGEPVYSTGVDVIEELGLRDIPFLKDFAKRAALTKELGTYYARYDEKKKCYVGMLTCVDPTSMLVHHSLNHTATKTTRLSSSTPNMQNIPRGDKSQVKAMFVSRFGADGRMGEIDYSQLEVVVQGLLTRDAQLVADLIARIDFHCKRVSAKFGVTYDEAVLFCKDEQWAIDNAAEHVVWKGRRTGVKEFSFQRAYGAGAAAIAAATGMPLEDVQDLMEKEDEMYPGITKFNDTVQKMVELSAEPFRDPERGWRQYRRGTWQSPTGTLYSFRSWDAPEFLRKRGITDSFSPPELKNYPVQGTGGELVQMALGVILRFFFAHNNWNGRAFLVNTVHDCIWIDAHVSVYKEVISAVKKIMESIPQMLKTFFNIDCPVPFPAEAEAGLNMLELKEHIH